MTLFQTGFLMGFVSAIILSGTLLMILVIRDLERRVNEMMESPDAEQPSRPNL